MFTRGRRIWEGALLVCVTVAAYLPALKGGFIWDDDTFLTQNRLIRAGDGLYRFWFTTQAPDYFPVTYSPLWLEWRLWGMNAVGYHAVNLALHVAGALLLWAVLARLRFRAAYVAALLFAVHPVNVESVAWITQRKNLMALVFYLASVWFFLGFIRGGAMRPRDATLDSAAAWRRGDASPHLSYILSLLCFTLGMLSKGSIALLPVVLLGIVAWHRPIRLRDVVATLPFFAVAAALVLTDIWFQKHGASEVFRNAGFGERLLGAGAAVWFYLGKALFPIHLAFIYPQWHIDPADARWWLPLLAAAGLTAFLLRYRKGPAKPALFAWGYFCVSLVPVMGFTDVQFMQYSLVADHYEQLALIGVVTLVAGEISEFGIRNSEFVFRFPLSAFRFGPIAATAAIGLLAALTFRQCESYRDAETLYRATLERNPDAWLAQSNLGSILYRTGRQTEAIDHFNAALRLKPDLFEAQNDLGLALMATGRLPEAMDHFEQAIRIHPDNAAVNYNAATALSGMGRLSQAVPFYERALQLTPRFAEAHQDLGATLTQLGRLPEAVEQYQEALQVRPDYFEAHANLGMVLEQLGRTAEARGELEAALRLQPNSPQVRASLDRLPAVP